MADFNTFSVFKGANVTLLFSNPAVTNITGWTLVFSVRQTAGSPAFVFQITGTLSANGQLTITDAANGKFSVNITAAGTNQLSAANNGTYIWDVWRTDAGFEDELAGGSFTVQGSARVGN